LKKYNKIHRFSATSTEISAVANNYRKAPTFCFICVNFKAV